MPHDWVIGLPFKNDPALASKGFYPIGRGYQENSVGWYRRVFDVPTEDRGKRISIEFDGDTVRRWLCSMATTSASTVAGTTRSAST